MSQKFRMVWLLVWWGSWYCGLGQKISSRENSEKIIGGSPVPQGAWSSVVALQQGNTSFCSGIALDATTIVTAAHCAEIAVDPNDPQINFAISSPLSTSSFLRNSLDKAYTHPYYLDNYDFGLGFLKNSLDLSIVTFPELVSEDELALIKKGDEVILVGFGQTEIGSSGKKRFTTTTIVKEIENDEITVGTSDHGACHGDSGGPAFIKINGIEKLLGVASRASADGCGEASYGLMTAMKPWIDARKLVNQGLFALSKSDFSLARDLCKKSLLYINAEADAYLCLAQVEINSTNYQSALSYLERYTQLAPLSEEGLLLTLSTHKALGMTAEVADDEIKLLNLRKILVLKQSLQSFLAAQSDYLSQNFAGAIVKLNEALRLDDQFEKYFAWRALSHMGLGEFQLALADVNSAIKLNPYYGKLYTTRSLINEKLGSDPSIRSADNALAKKLAYFDLSNQEFQNGQVNYYSLKFNQALLSFNNVIHLQPENPIYYLWRSKAERKLGQTTQADADLQLYADKVKQYSL